MIYVIRINYYDEKVQKPFSVIKIGYASNVNDRIKQYNTHNPFFALLFSFEGDTYLESLLHKRYSEFKCVRIEKNGFLKMIR